MHTNVTLPSCHQPGFRGTVKLKLKNDGLFFDFLDRGVHLKQITIKGRDKKTAICSYFGHAKLFFLVTKKCFQVIDAYVAQEFFDALMKIAEIGNKVNNTIRIGIAEENLYLGLMS